MAFFDSLCTNDIILPVRPPILLTALLALCATPLTAGPADEVTLERPPEALEVAFEAVSLVLVAVSLAASVVEACRLVWRALKRMCRSMMRDGTAVDIDDKWPDIQRRDILIEYQQASIRSVSLTLLYRSQTNFTIAN